MIRLIMEMVTLKKVKTTKQFGNLLRRKSGEHRDKKTYDRKKFPNLQVYKYQRED